MRTLGLLLAILATPALAGAVPITGDYGDDYGCKVAAIGDVDASKTIDSDPNDWVLVTPKGARGHEWDCTFTAARGPRVTASCSEAGDERPSRQIVSVVEHRQTGTLSYTDKAGTFTLHACR